MANLYNNYNRFLRNKYGCTIRKITVDAGFSCPNRDSTLSSEGCFFCSNKAFAPCFGESAKTVYEQVINSRNKISKHYKNAKFLVYFQPGTNTYGKREYIEEIYNQALVDNTIAGIIIGTRPDCIEENILDVLERIAEKTDLVLEIGLQSSHNKTLAAINRGHNYECFEKNVLKCHERNITVYTHLILGLPNETESQMIQTAKAISKLPVAGVKIHPFHVCKNTVFEKMYLDGKIKCMEFEKYAAITCSFLEYLRPDIVIARLTADVSHELLVAPQWINKKQELLAAIEKQLNETNGYQGKNCPD